MAFGYHDKILEIDLSSGTIGTFSLGPDSYERFLGGAALAAKIFFDRFDPGADPLGPDNPLLLMCGPLQGTNLPGASRFAMAAKSPLTGIWGEGTCGGNFSPTFKATGNDGIVFTGASAEPVYLWMEGDKAELRPAADLWGLDTYETNDILIERHGKGCRVLCIGPAGENGVLYANINNNKGDVIGRTGLGAVMGAKRLKAIAVSARGKVDIADPEAYKDLRKRVIDTLNASMPILSLKEMGTDASMDLGMMTGDVPVKNWTVGMDTDLAAAVGGPSMTDEYLTRGKSCTFCIVACKREVEVKDGPFKTAEGPGPEYETCGTFGTLLNNPDLAGVIKVNELCNRLGLDTISGGGTIAFAMDCFEKGVLTLDDTGGVDLSFGNIAGTIEMVKKIAAREGLGDVLALGSARAAEKIGKGAEQYAVTVKGLEVPMHDPRGAHGLGLAYMMSNIGASHMQHVNDAVERGITSYPEVGMKEDYEGQTSEGKAELVKLCEDVGQPLQSMVMCQFIAWGLDTDHLAEMVRTVTGFEFTRETLLAHGARSWLLKRSLDTLMGVRADDDRLPPRILTPLEDGAAEGSVPDVDLMKREYYAMRGLNEEGIPTREALEAAGLPEVAAKLHP